MDYIKEINTFYEYVKGSPLNAVTQVLWHKLGHEYYIINNQEWVELNDLKLMNILKLRKKFIS